MGESGEAESLANAGQQPQAKALISKCVTDLVLVFTVLANRTVSPLGPGNLAVQSVRSRLNLQLQEGIQTTGFYTV